MYTVQDLNDLKNHGAFNEGFNAKIEHIKNKDLPTIDPLLQPSFINAEYIELKSRMDNIERMAIEDEYILENGIQEVFEEPAADDVSKPEYVFIASKEIASALLVVPSSRELFVKKIKQLQEDLQNNNTVKKEKINRETLPKLVQEIQSNRDITPQEATMLKEYIQNIQRNYINSRDSAALMTSVDVVGGGYTHSRATI